MSTTVSDRQYVIETIKEKVIIHSSDDVINITPKGEQVANWVLDFRIGFSHKPFLDAIARLFWEQFDQDHPYQIGGLESASLPLMTSLMLSGNQSTGFYIRKSRKKKGFLRLIEGDVTDERDIVLVDDLINSGSSFMKQVKVLESERGLKVKAIFAIVRFRPPEFYKQFEELGITVHSLFDLADLGLKYGVQKVYKAKQSDFFWNFAGGKPHFFEQGLKNVPIIHRNTVLYTTDDGYVRCLDMDNGTVRWQRKVLLRTNVVFKTFPSSLVHDDVLYISTYRGSILALQTDTGAPLFNHSVTNRFMTPPIMFNGSLVFGSREGVGGGAHSLQSFDPKTQEVSTVLHAQSRLVGRFLVDEKRQYLFCADKNNIVYCFNAEHKIVWQRECSGANVAGVSTNDMGDVVVINNDGATVVLHPETGKTVDSFTLPALHYQPPTCVGHRFYGAILDRYVYCYDYKTHTMVWEFDANGRVYSSPAVSDDQVLVGDNHGRVYVLDRATGKQLALTIFAERVTNPILVTGKYTLISTFADELYMMKRIPSEAPTVAHETNHQATDRDSKHRDGNHT